jgi:hypothetical protein
MEYIGKSMQMTYLDIRKLTHGCKLCDACVNSSTSPASSSQTILCMYEQASTHSKYVGVTMRKYARRAPAHPVFPYGLTSNAQTPGEHGLLVVEYSFIHWPLDRVQDRGANSLCQTDVISVWPLPTVEYHNHTGMLPYHTFADYLVKILEVFLCGKGRLKK